MNLINFLLYLASLVRKPIPWPWGRAGTPARQRKPRNAYRDLMLMHPTMNIRKRMRLANQGRVYGWFGRLRYG